MDFQKLWDNITNIACLLLIISLATVTFYILCPIVGYYYAFIVLLIIIAVGAYEARQKLQR